MAESGGIIVTSAQAISGARTITVIEPGGARRTATVIGSDRTSGLAVVKIADDLPAATFDSTDPVAGSVTVAVALGPGRQVDAPPTAQVYAGTVVSSGQVMEGASPAGLTVTAVRAPLSGDDIGCPLLDSAGQVTGMLGAVVHTGTSVLSVFLPAELVLGVAEDLVSSGEVDHGWLGITAGDPAAATVSTPSTSIGVGATVPSGGAGAGVQLRTVDGDSPAAAAGLVAGDVITAIDGEQVHSAAELATRLYRTRREPISRSPL